MGMSDLTDVQNELFNLMVDVLVDMADPPEEEEEDAYDDMRAVVSVLFEAVELSVKSVEDGVITATLRVD